ncbi:MAG: AbrB/MazE/SpoVT family DNA-binding domain-containing protein [Tepidiformaceae bacterium]
METVTISAKYQIVLPASVRRSLGLRPGQKVMVIERGASIELVPVKPMEEYRGILRGVAADFERDDDRI